MNTVNENLKTYIEENELSLSKIAKATGITYNNLWAILNRRKSIRLNDYVALCRAFKEPLEKFIPKE